MNKFLTWFVVSSENPNAFSMTFKGLLMANIGVVMFILHYFNVGYSVEQVTNIIGVLAGFLGSALFTAGLLRKLWYLVFPKKEELI